MLYVMLTYGKTHKCFLNKVKYIEGIVDAPVSNWLIIKQGVPECLNISTIVEQVLWIHLVVDA